MFRASRIIFRTKEEYLGIPMLYLIGFPMIFGVSYSNVKFLCKPIECNDKSLGNYYRDSIFWSPQ